MACLVVGGEAWSWGSNYTTIYGTPTNLGALAFNILMSIAGGIIGAWIMTRDPFWMMSGALAGIISCASGLDIYYPAMSLVIAFGAGVLLKPAANVLENMGIDDAVGAVTVHDDWHLRYACSWHRGIRLSAALGEGAAVTSFVGQLRARLCLSLSASSGICFSLILKMLGMLRVPGLQKLQAWIL